ncbi:MAG: TIM barrel protein [Comamonadaceae bacterium]|nr:TIM barrel protein [Comamonadaceae bacterium]
MNRLRAIAPAVIGCNFDPSHLFWQGADPVAAIRAIGDGIFHVHAKDCKLDAANIAVNGVLDAKPYTQELERSWIFRTVGYGNGAPVWKAMVSALRLVGYDHVLSIEHEDSLMSGTEGLKKAIAFLKEVVITEPAGEATGRTGVSEAVPSDGARQEVFRVAAAWPSSIMGGESPVRILIVEDDAKVAGALKSGLAAEGCDAVGGADGRRRATTWPPPSRSTPSCWT